ncbi:MAG: hypothetical protein KGI75_00930 [Rhizobiaceae bacterium]|nr:hypothetical protein [Rhizobiaceae bacterium]
MAAKIATLNLKWKAFRNFFDFAPTDAELARGAFGLGQDNGAQTFSKMLSGDQGVPLDTLQLMAERINKQALAHRALRSMKEPLGPLAITAIDLAESSLFDFVRKLVSLSPNPDPDRLDQLHRDLIDALAPQPGLKSDDISLMIERTTNERSFAPFMPEGDDGNPTVFEPGRHFGQFSIKGAMPDGRGQQPFAYVFLRRDAASIGLRVWEQRFPETFLWMASPFPLKAVNGVAELFPQPVAVLPQPGRYRAVAVLIRDPQTFRRIDPRLDPRRNTDETPPPARLDEAASIRFLTNVSRAIERRDPAVAVAMADYIVAMPSEQEAV